MNNQTTGKLLVIAAPSGAGKTSLVKGLIESNDDVQVAISHTTRTPRPEETFGENYFFVTKQQFLNMRMEDEFVESATVFGNLYGTSRNEVRRILDSGHHLVLEIDWQGAAQVRDSEPDAISVFILPPSLETLRQRLLGRAQDDDETITKRMAAAMDEMSHYREFDYLVINDHFDVALSEITDILRGRGARLTLEAQSARFAPLIAELLPGL